jgi:RHS repeat-associated protein
LGKDIIGSVMTATNEYGTMEERYEYDAFGKPYQGDLTTGMNLGYTGKPYDTATGLYNYGYRDYQPEAARFTTVDPIRDGANWFTYVNNDPVNWVDLWGLRPLTQEERDLHKNAGGSSVDYDKIDVNTDRMPTKDEVKGVATGLGVPNMMTDGEIQAIIDEHPAMSLPGTIYVPKDPNRTKDQNKALLAHEIEHQAQYQNGLNGTTAEVFSKLVVEAQKGPSVYKDPNSLEGKAQKVEDRANNILGGKNKGSCAN